MTLFLCCGNTKIMSQFLIEAKEADVIGSGILSQEEQQRVFAPLEKAETLPARCFFDPEFFASEREEIFKKRWVALTFEAVVAQLNAAYPCEIADIPVLVTRDGEGCLRTFLNISPFDRAPIVMEPRSGCSNIEASYHGFVYNFDGSLRQAPYWSGRKDCSAQDMGAHALDLVPLASAVWRGIVFVNGSSNPPSFSEFIAPLEERLTGFDLSNLAIGLTELSDRPDIDRLEMGGNWKTVFENACMNVYHEGFVHDAYRKSPDVPRVTEDGQRTFEPVNDRGLTGLIFDEDHSSETYQALPLPKILMRDGSQSTQRLILSLYPNLFFSVLGEHVNATILRPLGSENSEMMMAKFFDRSVAQCEEQAVMRLLVREGWRQAGNEDAAIVRGIQKGRRAFPNATGCFAPFWDSAHHSFTKMVASDLGANSMPEDLK
jgi:choline monooxygenase